MGENPINILTNHEYYKVEKIIEQIKPFWTKYDSLSEKDMMLLESNFTHRFPEDMREFFCGLTVEQVNFTIFTFPCGH